MTARLRARCAPAVGLQAVGFGPAQGRQTLFRPRVGGRSLAHPQGHEGGRYVLFGAAERTHGAQTEGIGFKFLSVRQR